jgi:hypothetical protein
MIVALDAILPLGGIVFGAGVGGIRRWSGVASTISTTGLDGVAQLGPGGGHAMMDACREVALSGVAVVSM